MLVESFNVNGLRARLSLLERHLAQRAPDVIGLQETKVVDEDFPLESIKRMGYEICYHGQKGHYGVAVLSRHPMDLLYKGFPDDAKDAQRRLISVRVKPANDEAFTLINGYFPQGESRAHPQKFPAKRKFYADARDFLHTYFQPAEPVMLMGDFNVAYEDQDIGIGADNMKRWLQTGKCSFLPEERLWMKALLDWGLQDSFRHCHPTEQELFSWFDYRSRGFERHPKRGLRIDGILVTKALLQRLHSAGIDYHTRGQDKPSDHAPVWLRLGALGHK